MLLTALILAVVTNVKLPVQSLFYSGQARRERGSCELDITPVPPTALDTQ